MSNTPFADRLCEAIRRKGTPAMVGIDPSWENLPPEVRNEIDQIDWAAAARHPDFPDELPLPKRSFKAHERAAWSYWRFLEPLVDMAAEKVAIVKVQLAFFEAAGQIGLVALREVAKRAKDAGLLVIFDGKRNDIGNTAAAYAEAYLKSDGVWASDALTVNPYLGEEGLTPFVDVAQTCGSGIFVLVRTSNPGAGKLQDALINGRPVYSVVADWVREAAERTKGDSKYSPVGAVVGATVPQQLADLRKQLPSSILLIPGYGAQGGTAKDCAAAFDENGLGAIVNNSRGILYAWKKPEYAGMHWLDASRAALDKMIAEFKTVAPIK